MPALEPALPNHWSITSLWGVGVGFPVPTFPSKSQSPLRHPGQRDTLFEREAGTYLRLRRVRLAQRAPISAATPVSLMELLCRLQTEERAHLVWLSQDLEGATSPAEALNFTGSWEVPGAIVTPHRSSHHPSFLSHLPHSSSS